MRNRYLVHAVVLSVMVFALSAVSVAQSPDAAVNPPQSLLKFRFSAAPVYQFSTDLDGGGDFSVARFFIDFSAVSSMKKNFRLGMGLNYQYADYDFSGSTRFGADGPWEQIHSFGFSIPLFYNPSKDWTLFIGPSIRFDAESGADWGDAFTYGGILSASYRFSSNLTLGPGVGLFDRFGEFKAFPFIAIFWKINDQFRVGNPFRAGPVGPAGLELAYTPVENWEFAVGGAYRSFRFRLDDAGVAPKGSGEERSFPIFARAKRQLGPNIAIELLGGVLVGGELTLRDKDENKLQAEDYDPAPFISLQLSGRF